MYEIYIVPDFIIEILSKSTEDRDRGVKFQDYQMHGVKEYWIIDPDAEMIEQYINEDNHFHLTSKFSEGELNCYVIKGLTIPVKAIFDNTRTFSYLNDIGQ